MNKSPDNLRVKLPITSVSQWREGERPELLTFWTGFGWRSTAAEFHYHWHAQVTGVANLNLHGVPHNSKVMVECCNEI